MEIEETTTIENIDNDFVDIGGVEQSVSDGNRPSYYSILKSIYLETLLVTMKKTKEKQTPQ